MPTPILDNLKRRGELYRIAGPTGQQYDDRVSRAAAELAMKLLPRAVPIDATNVCRWISDQGPDTNLHEVRDQPGLMPPWEVAWIEWNWSFDPMVVNSYVINQGACLVASPREVDESAVKLAADEWGFDRRTVGAEQWIAAPHRFALFGPFLPWPGQSGAVIGPWGKYDCIMDEDGYLQDLPEANDEPGFADHLAVFAAGSQITELARQDRKIKFHSSTLPIEIASAVALRTFQFANCQNVELAEVEPQLSRQQRRLHERTGQPVNTWKELRIGAIGGKHGASSPGPSQGLVRQHICRGHFATYTEERKLFGKYAGRFWVPATVKGNPERGKADKGYIVEAPAHAQ